MDFELYMVRHPSTGQFLVSKGNTHPVWAAIPQNAQLYKSIGAARAAISYCYFNDPSSPIFELVKIRPAITEVIVERERLEKIRAGREASVKKESQEMKRQYIEQIRREIAERSVKLAELEK